MSAASEPDTSPAKRTGLPGRITAATVVEIAALAAVPTMAMLALAIVSVVEVVVLDPREDFDDEFRHPELTDVDAAGVATAIAPPEPTAVPAGVPKTGQMSEAMAKVASRNIGADIQGGPPRARLQRALVRTGAWARVAGGCHAARDTLAAIEAAGFEIERYRWLTIAPCLVTLPLAPHVLGVAGRPA
jgi:hypothetical protein